MARPEGKRQFVRPRRKCEDNITMYIQEVDGEAWTGLMWLRLGTGGRRL